MSMGKFFAPMLPTERRTVSVVAIIAMCRMVGLFALLPVLAIYAAGLEGATPALIGLAVGGYGLTQAVLQIPFGALSDRIGRIPVIIFGLILFAAGSLWAAQSTDIFGVIAGRFLQGAGAISATLSALLADGTREEMRTRSMAILGIGIGSSFLLALVVGPLIAAQSGVRSLFMLAAGLAGLAGFLLLFLPRGLQHANASSSSNIAAAFRPDLLRLDLYIFLLHTLLTASFVALPFVLRNQLGLELTAHWKIYVGALVTSLIGTIPLIVRDERQGQAANIAIALALLLIGQAMLALGGHSLWLVFGALAIFFAGFNFLEAGLPARLSIKAQGTARGASLGVFSSSQFLGAFAGGLLGGRLLADANPAGVFLAGALICAIWLVVHRLGASGS